MASFQLAQPHGEHDQLYVYHLFLTLAMHFNIITTRYITDNLCTKCVCQMIDLTTNLSTCIIISMACKKCIQMKHFSNIYF